jgi:hypothetical protein
MFADALLAGHLAHCISIPATYFNDKWGTTACNHQGLDARMTYFVAYYVGLEKNRRIFKIIKDGATYPNLALGHTVHDQFRALWFAHGQRRVPFYSLEAVDDGALPDPATIPYLTIPTRRSGMSTKVWGWEVLHRGVQHSENVYDTLNAGVSTLLSQRPIRLFPYQNNNCHIDTWFVVQLAFYTFSTRNAGGTAAYTGATWPVAYRRMFRVLSCIPDPLIANSNRDLYLKYEQALHASTTTRAWGQTNDYSRHTATLVQFAQREGKGECTKTRSDRLIGTHVHSPCSVCPAAETPARTMWHPNIPGNRWWWPISDQDAAIRDDDGRVCGHKDVGAYAKSHGSMTDAVLSHLHRDDLTHVPCQNHTTDRPDAYTTKVKDGAQAHLPRMLELDNGDMGINYPAVGSIFTLENNLEEYIDIGHGLAYRLIALTYYNRNHYVASVLLQGTWYKYNDMGHAPTTPNTPRTSNHLIACTFREAATPPDGFHHRSYVFSLTDVDHPGVRALQQVAWEKYAAPVYSNLAMLVGSDNEDSDDDDQAITSSPVMD